jgi:hypothetical protein
MAAQTRETAARPMAAVSSVVRLDVAGARYRLSFVAPFRHFPGVGIAGIPQGPRWSWQWPGVL